MKRIPEIKSGWIILAMVVAWQAIGACMFMLGPYATLGEIATTAMPEEQFGYSPELLNRWLTEIDTVGRTIYQQFQWIDALFAAVTAVTLTFGLAFTLSRIFKENRLVRLLYLVPIVVFGLELLENSILYLSASSYPELNGASFGSVVTSVKLVLGFGTILLFLFSAVWLISKQVFIGSKREPTSEGRDGADQQRFGE